MYVHCRRNDKALAEQPHLRRCSLRSCWLPLGLRRLGSFVLVSYSILCWTRVSRSSIFCKHSIQACGDPDVTSRTSPCDGNNNLQVCGRCQIPQVYLHTRRCSLLPFTGQTHLEDMLHGLELGAQVVRLLCVLLEELVREALLGHQHGLKRKPLGFGVTNLIPEFWYKLSTSGKHDTKHVLQECCAPALLLSGLIRAFNPEGLVITFTTLCRKR